MTILASPPLVAAAGAFLFGVASFAFWLLGFRRGFDDGWDAACSTRITRLRGSTVEYHNGAAYVAAPSDRHAADILVEITRPVPHSLTRGEKP
jgi:hypothetical protein